MEPPYTYSQSDVDTLNVLLRYGVISLTLYDNGSAALSLADEKYRFPSIQAAYWYLAGKKGIIPRAMEEIL